MAQISDNIERFIKELFEGDESVELRRNELAQHFGCAPSQINYVLSTRFTPSHGYVIESRRGGGGYVRIVRVLLSDPLTELTRRIGNAISRADAHAIIGQLLEGGVVTPAVARVMLAAVMDTALALPISAKDVLRAAVLRNMLQAVFTQPRDAQRP